jgi:flagellin-like hook-associated protein FlgL
MENISLNASVRSILLSLQKSTDEIGTVQNRLASGKKVSSALDNASAYFTARSLTNRADDLASVKDGIINGLNVVKAATKGLEGIEKILVQMKGIAEQAKSATTTADRSKYSDQYDALRTELDNLAKDASYNGVNLLKATPDDLTVTFNEDASATYTIDGIASDSAGLAVTAANDWDNATLATGTTNVEGDITKLTTALSTVRANAATMGSSGSLLQIRSDFTTNMISTLRSGSDSLTNADLNEEAANMLALQTRQQLANNALAMANQSAQSVLRLFG